MKWKDLTREAQVLMYVVGTLDGLKAKGLVQGGRFQVGAAGKDEFDDMVASGFSPTQAEIEMVLGFLQRQAASDY
jgi:hypothetical protein